MSIAVTVGSHPLTPRDVVAVAREGAPVALDPAALTRVAETRALIEGLADDPQPHYGISTGFGALATTFIAPTVARTCRRASSGPTPPAPARRSSGRSRAP